MSSDSTRSSPLFFRKYDSALSLYAVKLSVSMLRVEIFSVAVSPERNVRGVMTTSDLPSITAIRCSAWACQGSIVIFRNRSIASAGFASSISYSEAVVN